MHNARGHEQPVICCHHIEGRPIGSDQPARGRELHDTERQTVERCRCTSRRLLSHVETPTNLQRAADMGQQALQDLGRAAIERRRPTRAMDAERIDAAARQASLQWAAPRQAAHRHHPVEDVGVGLHQLAIDTALLPVEVAHQVGTQHGAVENAALESGNPPGIVLVVVCAVEFGFLRRDAQHRQHIDRAVGRVLSGEGQGRAVEQRAQATPDLAPGHMAQCRVIKQADCFGFLAGLHDPAPPSAALPSYARRGIFHLDFGAGGAWLRASRPALEAQHLGLDHAFDGADLAHQLLADRLVDLNEGDRRAAGIVAAQMEGRDIDLVFTQQSP